MEILNANERKKVQAIKLAPIVDCIQRASILLTDSGGIQEEGPSLDKPVLVNARSFRAP